MYTYEKIKIDKCQHASCENDYECLSNKCFNKYRVFNDENPIVRCDSYYKQTSLISIRGSYMHCGKPYGDSCKTNDECSSKECESNTCWIRTGGPSNPESVYIMFNFIFPLFFLITLVIICWC